METEDQTTIVTKKSLAGAKDNGDSHFGGISIRAWLALFTIGTVCAVTLIQCVVAAFYKEVFTIDGQFWMLVGAVIAHYYKEKMPATPPAK